MFQLIVNKFGRLFLIKTVHLEVGWVSDRGSFPDCTDFWENASQENLIKSILLTTTPLYISTLPLPFAQCKQRRRCFIAKTRTSANLKMVACAQLMDFWAGFYILSLRCFGQFENWNVWAVWEENLTLEMMFQKLGSKLLTGVVGGTGAGLFLASR